MKNNKPKENYLDRIPCRPAELNWSQDDTGAVTLDIENKGVFNRIAQKLLKKPKVSHIHLDEFGSFIWLQIDGERDLTAIGRLVGEHFGDKAEPLYERLARYFKTLESYKFINWSNKGD